MDSYQQLYENLHKLKSTQIKLKIYNYINKINDHKTSVIDLLCKSTSEEVKIKNFNLAHSKVKIASFL